MEEGHTGIRRQGGDGRNHATFAVCAIAMENQKVDRSQRLANGQVVPDGIGEIVAKQRGGRGNRLAPAEALDGKTSG